MGTRKVVLKYNDAERHIAEGDVLLFRGQTLISRLIKAFGGSPYTHVGIASWHDFKTAPSILECIEFKEWVGGRTSSLKNQVSQFRGTIDVYRPNSYFYNYYYHIGMNKIVEVKNRFEGKKVTACMRNLTGLPYGYTRIWYIAKLKLAGVRLFIDYNSLIDDKTKDIVYPVCSTVIAHCFSKNGYDLVKNRSDEYTEPSDIARSSNLDYLFTLRP